MADGTPEVFFADSCPWAGRHEFWAHVSQVRDLVDFAEDPCKDLEMLQLQKVLFK